MKKSKTFLITALCAVTFVVLGLVIVFNNDGRNGYVYSMEDIRQWHKGDDLIEILGYAEEPYKELIRISLAPTDNFSALVYDQPKARRKTFHSIDGYGTVLHPFLGKDGRMVYAVLKERPVEPKRRTDTDERSYVVSQQSPAGDVLKAAPEE